MTDQAPELLPCPVCSSMDQWRCGEEGCPRPSGEAEIERLKGELERARGLLTLVLHTEARPTPSERPVAQVREAIKNAIRTFCQSLGANVVAMSSDEVERIYYPGLSLDALSVAATMAALRSSERPSEAVVAWTLHKQPADMLVDHAYSIWLGDEPVALCNVMAGQSDAHLKKIVALLNAIPHGDAERVQATSRASATACDHLTTEKADGK